ncbi:MAG: translation initiation factor IF-2 [Bacteroidia bacterium]|jgi:translation initiation factor IF-2|nr:translation initiation factor IF-2 [Bacteroidia bacterium]
MSENTGNIRISKVVKEIGVGIGTIVEHLSKKGFKVDNNPNAKITEEQYAVLLKDFQSDKKTKDEALQMSKAKSTKKEEVVVSAPKAKEPVADEEEDDGILIKSGLAKEISVPKPEKQAPKLEVTPLEPEVVVPPTPPAPEEEKPQLKVIGKIDLEAVKKPKGKKAAAKEEEASPETKPVTETPKAKKTKVEEVKAEEPVVTIHEPVVEPEVMPPPADPEPPKVMDPNYEKLSGLKVMGKIELPVEQPKKPTPIASSDGSLAGKKKRRRNNFVAGSDNVDSKKFEYKPGERPVGGQGNNRPNTGAPNQGGNRFGNNRPAQGNRPYTPNPNYKGKNDRNAPPEVKEEITEKQIQDKLKETLARLNPGSKPQNIGAVRSKIRKQKRDAAADKREEEALELEGQRKIKVTEFVTANELAQLMEVPVTNIISACMSLGLMVSINQRLDAETIAIVAEEFGFETEFVSADLQEEVEEEIDSEEDLLPRAPIVTVMGHVDHGKTSLLDYIRKANVIAGEAGGITQHIGAYEVTLANGKHVTFLDTPGHEAFTAMRARGAKITDIVIIVIAADDSVMPQTKEAISHAQAAGVPIVFAINKIDREGANPDKIREQLAAMNILVEEWGGKYQCQEISAKKGLNIDALLEKVLLEAEILNLKANPNKRAVGSVIESSLDKGRGLTVTLMVQSGTMRVGDPILAGIHSGKVRAMFDERGKKMMEAGPSAPVVILGFNGAPQAGDKFIVTKNDQEAKEISNKRTQLQREQGIRTQKHITLDEIGRRLAIGNFKELKVIVKGDVDGSVEALSDSLIKLSTEEVQVSVIYKGVGQISESDVLLASASDAIMVAFNVRPSPQARKLAETESIDIRMYSIIYNAINEIKAAIEGMLAPTTEEKITGNVEIREVFKITKVGTIAGCYVTDGKIFRNSKVRIIRSGVVIHDGELESLKRFKDDVKEVGYGFECGLGIKNFNDLQVGDYVEAYEIVEVKRTLK